MTHDSWRAVELSTPNGAIVVDVSGSGRFAHTCVTWQREGLKQEITSLEALAEVIALSGGDSKSLAEAGPAGFAYVVCLLSDRAHHIFPRETMWPELERYFSLNRLECGPKVVDNQFQFVAYSSYMPVLKLSRLTVDLVTLQVSEEPLVSSPWPPEPAGV